MIIITVIIIAIMWCRGIGVITTSQYHSINPELGSAQVQTSSWRVRDSRWRGSLTMVLAGNKAKRLFSVNHTTKKFIIIVVIK